MHGLDAAVRLEVTGRDGAPIEHDVAHGVPRAGDSELAHRALEAIYGAAAPSMTAVPSADHFALFALFAQG